MTTLLLVLILAAAAVPLVRAVRSGSAGAVVELLQHVGGAEYTVERLDEVCPTGLPECRAVDVYLPPGYARDTGRRYPVLYVNDGQDLPALDAKATLERLVRERRIEPPIVVGVHATADRRREYGTAEGPNAQGLGDRASAYGAFLRVELVPLVERRYRTLAGREHRALLGWSLGGLAAFDLAWRAPETFGAVGVFSGSFWWRADDASVAAKQASRLAHAMVRRGRGAVWPRVWLEAGTLDETDDRDGNGVIDAIQDTTELMDELVRVGYRVGEDVVYVEVTGGHDHATWGGVLPDFLRWAFPAA